MNRNVPMFLILLLMGIARAEAAATTIDVTGTVDDFPATVTVNGVEATIANDGIYTFTADNVPLEYGTNTIKAVATNSSGLQGESSIQVHVHSDVLIQGTVVDASAVTVKVQTANDEVDADVNGSQFSASVPLPLGLNTVTATATDTSNNVDIDTINIYVVRPPIDHPTP